MEFKRIIDTSDINFKLSWDTYTDNFPDYEKRLIHSHKAAINNKNFHAYAVYDNNKYIAFIFYWYLKPFIYIEHFAIEEEFRNKSYGSKIINKVIKDNNMCKILLEIDPVVDDISKRRFAFYKRLDFTNNDLVHYNLPYQINLTGYRLDLLSHNGKITSEQYKHFYELLKDSAYKYCE